MGSSLPKRSPQHVSGERGLAVLRLHLPETWIMREQATSDYGIDVEIELADERVKGILCKGQVRSKTPIQWRTDDTYREPVGSNKLLYWKVLPLPVVLFLVDNEKNEAFWEPVESSAPAVTSFSDDVIVSKVRKLPDTSEDLERYIRSYVHYSTARRALYRLPGTMRRLQQRLESLDYDCFMALEDDVYSETQEFFDEVLSLRESVGLSNTKIVPWLVWSERSQAIFGDSGKLHWGVHDEMVIYLKTLVEEAVEQAKEILSKEDPTAENAAVKSYFDKISYCFSHNLRDRLDWDRIEALIEAQQARKYHVKRKK